jgi:hypothetical protein
MSDTPSAVFSLRVAAGMVSPIAIVILCLQCEWLWLSDIPGR